RLAAEEAQEGPSGNAEPRGPVRGQVGGGGAGPRHEVVGGGGRGPGQLEARDPERTGPERRQAHIDAIESVELVEHVGLLLEAEVQPATRRRDVAPVSE